MVVISSSFAAPAEGIILQQPSTKLLINDIEIGTATLYITEFSVVWGGGTRPSGIAAPAISLQYSSISLHATQRDPYALYLIVNYEIRLPELGNTNGGAGDTDDESFDAEDTPITQLRFVPANEGDLQPMYNAMCEGQALHPDPADEVDENEMFMDGEDFEEGSDEFEDAEENQAQGEDPADRLRQMRLDTNGHYDEDDNCQMPEE